MFLIPILRNWRTGLIARLSDIGMIFEDSLKNTQFDRHPLFYSLFTTLFHLRWGLRNLDLPTLPEAEWNTHASASV